jgi:hypothetical protein
MKKVLLILMLSLFALGSSGFKNLESKEAIDPCFEEAIEVGETMDGYNGKSGAYYAFIYMRTFCMSDSFVNN